jgi:glycosyltransferase involved in cell wall biosynthesis
LFALDIGAAGAPRRAIPVVPTTALFPPEKPGSEAPLHVVHVLTRMLRGGSEENTVATALWQAARGHRVTVLHGGTADPHWQAALGGKVALRQVVSLRHPVDPLADARACLSLRGIYRDLAPDVIHTHQSKAGILGRLAAAAVPSAAVIHGIHIVPFAGAGMVRRLAYVTAERGMARRTDRFIAVSQGTAASYAAGGICDVSDVTVVRSGMDLAAFGAARPPKDAAALIGADLSGPDRPPVILMLAAFEPRKRHGAFLAAFRSVVARCPRVRLLLAGAGTEEASARTLTGDLGLAGNVTFCGHRPDPQALIALADLTVLASEREGLPRVVVQSLAGGRPVVLSGLPGIDEVVSHGRNGLIAPAQDLNALADAISDLIEDRPRLARLAAGARATDLSDWDLDRLGAATTAVYRQALAERRA